MPIVMAGHRRRVPQSSFYFLLVLALAGLGGCGTKSNNYPSAKDTGALTVAPAVLVTPPQATPAPSTPTAIEPAPAFLSEPVSTQTQTSNGGDLLTAPPTIVVEEPTRSALPITATGLYMYGAVGGSVQVPKGGANGTSNADRPHFNSIGIKTASIGDGELDARLDEHSEVFVGAQIIRLGGGADLGVETLTTNGVTFPAGAHVASDVTLDWYRVGYRYTFPINTAANGIPDLTFTPWASAIVLDFGYHLTANKVAPASRSFTKVGAQIGATFAWRPKGGPLSLEAAIGGFPTMNDVPTISVESLYARYHFYEWRRFDFTGLLGVAWEQQEFRDDRALPDHISANFGPMLLTGVQVKF